MDGWARTQAAYHCGTDIVRRVIWSGSEGYGRFIDWSPHALDGLLFSDPRAFNKVYLKMRRIENNRWFSCFSGFFCGGVSSKEDLDFKGILLFCLCFTWIWHIFGSSKRILQRQTRLQRGRAVEGHGNLCGAGDCLWICAATVVTDREEPWLLHSYWCSAGLWSLRLWELRMTRNRSSWRANVSWSATLIRQRTGRLHPLRSASRCAPPTPRWLSLQSGATTTNRRKWATKQE